MSKLKRIIVNRHRINSNRKHGMHEPVLSIHASGVPVEYGHEIDVVVDGKVVGTFIYRPEKPQSCGASIWFATRAELRVRLTKRQRPRKTKKTTALEEILDAATCHVNDWPTWMQLAEHRMREPAGNRAQR